MAKLGYREVVALVFEALAKRPRGSHDELANEVLTLAEAKGMIVPSNYQRGVVVMGAPAGSGLPPQEQSRLRMLVQEAMWDLIVKRVLVIGMNEPNAEWPFYRLSERGFEAVKKGAPQPYDPDGFLKHFHATVGTVDPVVGAYVAEAIQTFNTGCLRASAVMLGGASEKLILLLCDAFEKAISDPAKKAKFVKDSAAKWAITHKYAVLKDRFDRMVAAKKLPHQHAETVGSELPSGFELLRRSRNVGGHPEVPGNVDEDTAFLNLRAFTEYASRVTQLIGHFGTSPADW